MRTSILIAALASLALLLFINYTNYEVIYAVPRTVNIGSKQKILNPENYEIETFQHISEIEVTKTSLVELVENDHLCELAKIYREKEDAQAFLARALSAIGELPIVVENQTLNFEAEKELLSASNPFINSDRQNYRSNAARFFQALKKSNLISGVDNKVEDKFSKKEALVELEQVVRLDPENGYPHLFKAYLAYQLNSSEEDAKDDLRDALRKPLANDYSPVMKHAFYSRAFGSASSLYLILMAKKLLPVSDVGKILSWMERLIKKDSELSSLAMSFGYVMVRANWFFGDVFEDFLKSGLQYATGRTLLQVGHSVLLPESPLPNYPALDETKTSYRLVSPDLVKSITKLHSSESCERESFDKVFEEKRNLALGITPTEF